MSEMRCIIGGQELPFIDLGPEINAAFIKLYAAFLGSDVLNWSDFEKASIKFFDTPTDNHDKFFTNVAQILPYLFKNARWDDAEKILQSVTELAMEWESKHEGHFIHKGTPFYFLGTIAILRGDLDRGYILMHQAVMEDFRTEGKLLPSLPAYALVTLDYERPQFLQILFVKRQAEFVDDALAKYRRAYNKTLDLIGFRKRFLANPDNVEAVFMFVYTIARLINISHVPNYAIKSPFAGQLEINILLDLTVIIETLVQMKNTNKGLFQAQATYLAKQASLNITQPDLNEINGAGIKDFDKTMQNVTAGLYQLKVGSPLTGIDADLAIAYLIRNRAAHNISSASAIWERFPDISHRILNVLFLCIETLYLA